MRDRTVVGLLGPRDVRSRIETLVLTSATLGMLAGCVVAQVPATVTGRSTNPANAPAATKMAKVTGILKVPSQLKLAQGLSFAGAGLVSDNGAGLVSNHGGSLRILQNVSDPATQPSAEKPLETRLLQGARIHLADASGQPVPNLKTGTTGPDGGFVIPDVPPGSTLMIVARVPTASGAIAEFRSLVKLTPLGAATVLSPASTLVTTNLVDTLPGAELGDFKPSKFQSAIEAVDRRLTEANAPDFSDAKSVRNLITRLSEEIDELKSLMLEMRQDMKNVQQSLDAIQAAIKESKNTPVTPIPTAVTSTTPNPVPSAQSSASPAPTTASGATSGTPSSAPPSITPSTTPRPSALPTLAFGTGTITASTTNPVIKPGEMATVYISWTTKGCPDASVYLSVDGSDNVQLFGKAPSYSRAAAPWIKPGYVYDFKLYKDDSRTVLLSTVSIEAVEAVNEPTPTPSPRASGIQTNNNGTL